MTVPLRLVSPDDPVPATGAASVEEVFRRHSKYVASVAFRLLGREGEVDDIVQDVFLHSIDTLRQLKDPQAVRGWLGTVTVRIVRRRLRTRRIRAFLGLEWTPATEEIAAHGATPEESALLSRVYQVLDELPVDHRIAWALRHIEGERLEEVAQRCGCSLATAKRRIAAAHEVLDQVLSDE